MPLSLTLKPFAITTGKELVLGSSLASLTGAIVTTGYQIGIQWQGGALKLNGVLQAASESVYTYFSYDDFNAGKIKFTADGSATPDFSFALRDGSGAALLAQPAIPQIIYKHVNQAPVLAVDLGSLEEGQLKTVTADMIRLSDVDTPEDQLGEITLKVAKVSGGSFLLAGTAAKAFTYADVLHGLVSFQHDGKDLKDKLGAPVSPVISLQVVDAAAKPATSIAVNAHIDYHRVNDKPLISVLKPAVIKLALDKNGDAIPGRIMINTLIKVTSEDTPVKELSFSYEATDCRLVYLDSTKAYQNWNGNFTVADLPKLFIQMDDFNVALSDTLYRPRIPTLKLTELSSGAEATLTASANDPYAIGNGAYSLIAPTMNSIDLSELALGERLTVTTDMLDLVSQFKKISTQEIVNAIDVDPSYMEGMLFTISGIKGCSFLLYGQATTMFRYADVVAGKVQVVHLGQAGVNPSFSIIAKDTHGMSSKALAVDVSSEIALAVKTPLAITEGADLKLSTGNILITASKALLAAGFTLDVLEAEHGQVGLLDAKTKIFTPVESFSYDDLKAGKVIFRHNGDDTIPSLQLGVAGQAIWLPFTFKAVDDSPVLALKTLVLPSTQVLDSRIFTVSDEETPNSLRGGFLFTVNKTAGMIFHLTGTAATTATALKSFSLQDVDNGMISVTRTSETPSYSLGLTDPMGMALKAPVAGVVVTHNALPTGILEISGSTLQGNVLRAVNHSIADEDGLGIIHYQWQANGQDIQDETSTFLYLDESLVGKSITVKASYTDGHAVDEVLFSSASTSVTNINDTPNDGLLINGLAVQGQTLVADTSHLVDADGIGVLHYQWQADGVNIEDAQTSLLQISAAEVGKAISVSVSYTDGHDTSEIVRSAPTTKVVGQNLIDSHHISITIYDSAAADFFPEVTGALIADDHAAVFSGTIEGTYGYLAINAVGHYTYTPDILKINLLPAGNFKDEFEISATNQISLLTEKFNLKVNISGVDDQEYIYAYSTDDDFSHTVIASLNNNIVAAWEDRGEFSGINFLIADKSIYISGGSEDSVSNPEFVKINNDKIIVLYQAGDGNASGIYAQLYDASGNELYKDVNLNPAPILVNHQTTSYQESPQGILIDPNHYLVTWHSLNNTDWDVSAQIFDLSGNPQYNHDMQVAVSSSQHQVNPTANLLSNGDFLIAWEETDFDNINSINGRIFSPQGEARSQTDLTLLQNPDLDYFYPPEIVSTSNGGFSIFQSMRSDITFSVYVQSFDAQGQAIGSLDQVSSSTNSNAISSVKALKLSDDSYLVSWSEPEIDGLHTDIFTQHLDSNFQSLFSNQQDRRINMNTSGSQQDPSIVQLDNGNYALSWTGPINDGNAIFMSIYDAQDICIL